MDNLDSSNSGFNHIEDVNYPQLEVKQVNLITSVGGNITGMPILSDISFNIFSGSRLAIIGPSGAGKTSLFRLLNRLSEPTSGAIYLENQDYRKIPVLELRRQVMLVPQEAKLLGMTVKQALAYPLTLQQLPESQIQERLDIYMEKLHIPSDWLERTELQLSVGQKQLVAIARALVTQPKILLLDEPTSALDAGIASHLLSVLTDLTVQRQMTILMINHQLDIAQQFCTRVLYLQNAQLLQNTSVTQIDWKQLRESLVQAEAQSAVEWL